MRKGGHSPDVFYFTYSQSLFGVAIVVLSITSSGECFLQLLLFGASRDRAIFSQLNAIFEAVWVGVALT